MKTSESIKAIAPALLKAQKLMGAAKKDAENPFYKHNYADLGSVMEVCKGPLNENGIIVLQPVVGTFVETTLVHESGEWMSSETPIVTATQNDPQKLGSAISYARRYGLQSMLFIPAEDDDAEKATTHTPAPYIKQTTGEVVQPSTKATPKQLVAIHALLAAKGRTTASVHKKFGVEHTSDLTMAQASQLIDALDKMPDVVQEEKVNPDDVLV